MARAGVARGLGGDSLEQDFVRLEAGSSGGADVEDKLLALKSQMGLLGGATEEPKQLEAGDAPAPAAAPAAAPPAPPAAPAVQEAQVEEISEAEAAAIPEAQLLSEFDKLEGTSAES